MEAITVGTMSKFRKTCQTICERVLLIAGDAVHYRLLEHSPQYLVECVKGREQSLLPLGQRFPFAAHTFALLVEGEALPCTAADILADLTEG